MSDLFNDRLDQIQKWSRDCIGLMQKMQPHMRTLESIAKAVGGDLELSWSDTVVMTARFTSLKTEGARLIEALQHALGEDFDGTVDIANEYAASRKFSMRGLPFSLHVELPRDGEEGCRRVQVGQKTVPVYKLECDE